MIVPRWAVPDRQPGLALGLLREHPGGHLRPRGHRPLPAGHHLRRAMREISGWAAILRIDLAGAVLAAGATISLLLGPDLRRPGLRPSPRPRSPAGWRPASCSSRCSSSASGLVVDPVLPLGLFRNQVFSSVAVLSLGVGAVILSLAYYLPLFLQGLRPRPVGLTNSGAALRTAAHRQRDRRLDERLHRRPRRARTSGSPSGRPSGHGTLGDLPALGDHPVDLGGRGRRVHGHHRPLGFGIFFHHPTLAVQNAVPYTQLGVVTATTRYLQQVGATLGVAVVGSVVNNKLRDQQQHRREPACRGPPAAGAGAHRRDEPPGPDQPGLPRPGRRQRRQVRRAGRPADARQDLHRAAALARGGASGQGFVVVFGFSLVMLFLATMFLRRTFPCAPGWGAPRPPSRRPWVPLAGGAWVRPRTRRRTVRRGDPQR